LLVSPRYGVRRNRYVLSPHVGRQRRVPHFPGPLHSVFSASFDRVVRRRWYDR
jgi:hypothetical protein